MKFICYIKTDTNDYQEDDNEEYRRRLIDNNFELMNGSTIIVTTDPNKIPKYFIKLDNLEQLKAAVSQEMDNGGSLNLVLAAKSDARQ